MKDENEISQQIQKLDGMNFWVEDIGLPQLLVNVCQRLAKVINIAAYMFVGFEWGSFFTQHSLSEKQKADMFLMSFSHTVLYSFTVLMIHQKEIIKELLFTLAVELKKDFNDEEVERQMVKRTKFYLSAFAIICGNALVFYGIDGLIQVIHTDGTFVTLIPFWPDVDDRRAVAGAARVATYVFWWIFMARIMSAYTVVLPVTICLSHQFKNLQLYFKSLEHIFEQNNLSQKAKEVRYEKALKVGVKLHAHTLRCTQQAVQLCGPVYGGQIVVNITVLVLLMSQMVNSGRTMGNVLPIVTTIASVLVCTAVLMLNAGNITVEAANLPTAIFLSGWQNCQNQASRRIRRLLLIAITQSQKPVEIKCLGVIDLSYQSYITIVKTSYSIFSVLY